MVMPSRFVAQHTHGVDGNDALYPDTDKLAAAYDSIGVVAATPTLLTADVETLWSAQRAYLSSRHKGRKFIGLFSEGNFGAPSKRGCQNATLMEPLTWGGLERLFMPALDEGFPLRVMFAPETVTNLERTMKSILDEYENVSLVIGHSDATVAQALDAIRYGASGFVHFGNAMGGSIAQRNPIDADQIKELSQKPDSELGLKDMLFKYNGAQIMEATNGRKPYFEVIIDGIHVHPQFLLYMVKQYGTDNVVPVTDQMMGTGKPIGYEFDISGSMAIVAKPGGKNPYNGLPGQNVLLAVLKGTETLAGSLATDAHLYNNAVCWLTGDLAKRQDIGLAPLNEQDALDVAWRMSANSPRIHGYDMTKHVGSK